MSSYGGRGPTVNAVLWAETAVAVVIVGMRIYTRKVILNSLGLDDLMLVLTIGFMAAYASCITAGTIHGLGRLASELALGEPVEAMKMEILGQAICILNIAVSKSAIAFFLLRILAKGRHKAIIWVCIISTTIISCVCAAAAFLQCDPIPKVWNHQIPGECKLDFRTIGMTTSAYAVVMDFVLAIFPCFVVWGLKMKRKEKMIVVSGLSLGMFAGICGIFRTIHLTSLGAGTDYIYATTDMLIYSGTENFVTAVCASIPVLRPLYIKYIRGEASTNGSLDSSGHALPSYKNSRYLDNSIGKTNIKTRAYGGRREGQNQIHERDISEKLILQDIDAYHGARRSNLIAQIQVISVSYEGGNGNNNDMPGRRR